MTDKKIKQSKPGKEDSKLNEQWQGVDKDPAEEKGKAEKVTSRDLKGKKVDADPESESDKPKGDNI